MSLIFCLSIVKPFSLRTCLLLPTCLGICSFPFKHVFVVFFRFYFFKTKKKKKKKKLGEKMQNFIFLYIAFQILYVFLPDISIHCTLFEYAYI